jgi:prevent-host-death family protein
LANPPYQLAIDEEASASYIMPMRSVDLKVLKNKFSEYIRLVASGESVLITDRNRVVAELVPPQPGRTLTVQKEDLITQGVREGWLTPAKNPGPGPLPRKPVMTFEELMRDLDESRRQQSPLIATNKKRPRLAPRPLSHEERRGAAPSPM